MINSLFAENSQTNFSDVSFSKISKDINMEKFFKINKNTQLRIIYAVSFIALKMKKKEKIE